MTIKHLLYVQSNAKVIDSVVVADIRHCLSNEFKIIWKLPSFHITAKDRLIFAIIMIESSGHLCLQPEVC